MPSSYYDSFFQCYKGSILWHGDTRCFPGPFISVSVDVTIGNRVNEMLTSLRAVCLISYMLCIVSTFSRFSRGKQLLICLRKVFPWQLNQWKQIAWQLEMQFTHASSIRNVLFSKARQKLKKITSAKKENQDCLRHLLCPWFKKLRKQGSVKWPPRWSSPHLSHS